MQQNSLAYPDPKAPHARSHPWELDAFPLLIEAEEWRGVAAALRRAINLMVRKHRALGLPIVEGVGDDVVYLNPETLEEIPAAEVDAFIAKAQASWDE